MAIDKARIAKNTFFLYSRMLILMGISLFTVKIVLKALGAVDYGIYNVVGGVVFYFHLYIVLLLMLHNVSFLMRLVIKMLIN